MNTLALRDWPTVRQWIQFVAAALLALLAAKQIVTQEWVEAILLFIASVLPQTLSVFNTPAGRRRLLYGFLAALQLLLITLNLFNAVDVELWINFAVAVFGGGVAVTHTPTPLAARATPKVVGGQ